MVNEQLSMVSFSIKKRFFSKGIERPNLFVIRKILKAKNVLKYEEKGDDIVITYPIATISFQKIINN